MTFEEYVLARGPALVRLARLLAGDDHRAEDLVQDVLAKAYPRWARILRADDPDRYVRRMLVNARHSWWRRAARRPEVPLAALPPVPVDVPALDSADRDALWRLVSALPARQRAALALRYYEDLDDAAIAEILGCSPVTVRTHVMRGLATLRGNVGAAGFPSRATTRSNP
ncbi:SigE family RNA polymerase sigma factor [Asanoa siamensis]|uniref:RNA polymerase subunit sigma-24 n=1 Tax=Asanoa siamensis TaxID=926357 RepID=A0ABQ4D151_9ACTN|nr:SigE family RNA polymerase sigma factor [Asanoa siamensis]GIF77262.1 RNA polymerase subunit sigma-24 [Asanoa siamensis]